MKVLALRTVSEEVKTHFDDDVVLAYAIFLGMLEDNDMECLFGDTHEALNLFCRKGQVKRTVEKVTMAPLEC